MDIPKPLRPLWWNADARPGGALEIIDQTRLPGECVTVLCTRLEHVREAIKQLKVRGAPAIGVAAGYGVIVAMDEAAPDEHEWLPTLVRAAERLASSRPTAVNLAWALERMQRRARGMQSLGWSQVRSSLLAEAHAIRDEDAAMCRAIGQAGQPLIADGAGVLTHCNAGALATSEYGTALAPMYAAFDQGRKFRVFVDETRPLLQGSRLTAWELQRAGVPCTLICDNMAASLMAQGKVQLVITGADRIAANGDTANKIGTYGVAVLAEAHGLPFYVAAPASTFDLSLPDGSRIPIEVRGEEEVRTVGGRPIAPADVPCYCPAFDVTPARLIRGIITDRGLIQPVTTEKIAALMGR
jgi:methylthioribose-1-phosphate isomerase